MLKIQSISFDLFFNFFFKTSLGDANAMGMVDPWLRPGDYVLLKALTGLVWISTACPCDIDPANGWDPTDIQVRVYQEKEIFKKSIQDSAIKQSLEIVRKRIDESGTKEPLIQRSGRNRILLQLPGVKDPERIKDLLGKTAKLNFHMVDDDDTKSLSLNIAPCGRMIVADIENAEI